MKNFNTILKSVFLAAGMFCFISSYSQTVQMYSVEDASVTSKFPDSTIIGKNAAGANIFVWRNVNDTVYAYMKFDISKYAGYKLSDVKFSFRGAQYLGSADYQIMLYGSGDTWNEDTINWNNKPKPGTKLLAQRDLSSSSARRDMVSNAGELISYINGKLATGNQYVSFVFKSTGIDNAETFDNMWIGSSEDGSYAPQLMMTFANAGVFTIEDATVTSQFPDSTIMGKAVGSKNNIFAWRNAADTTIAYIKFDISKFAGYKLSDVKFSVRGAQYLSATDYQMEVYTVSDVWKEDSITWNNKPKPNTKLMASRDLSSSSARRDFNNNAAELLNFINGKMASGSKYIAFVIKSAGTQDNATKPADMWIGSKEDGSYAPQLVFTFASVSAYDMEDATVTSQYPDSTIMGKAPGLKNNIFAWRNAADTTIAYIKFDITKFAGLKASDVIFSVRGAQYLGATDYQMMVYGTGDNWKEDSVTWNKRPAPGSKLLATRDLSSSSGRRDFVNNSAEMLNYVNGKLASGAQYVSFVIKSGGTQDNATKTADMWIGSFEDGTYAPQLTFKMESKPQKPVLQPGTASYLLSVKVNVVNQPPADTVRYTFAEGSEPADPTKASPIWPAGGLELTKTTTVKAKAYNKDSTAVTTETYTVKKVSAPEFLPSPVPKYQPPIEVVIVAQPEGSVILYCDEAGCNPSTPYTEPIPLTKTTTLRAKACTSDFLECSEVVEVSYTLIPPAGTAGNGPGGVGYKDLTRTGQPELGLWLKPESITGKSNGDQVTEWPDASGNSNKAINTGVIDAAIPETGEKEKAAPVFLTDVLNGKPVLQFGMPNTDVTRGSLFVADADNLDGGEGLSLFLVMKRNELYPDFAALIQKRDIRGGDAKKQAYTFEMNGGDNPNKVQWVVTRDIFLRNDSALSDQRYYILGAGLNGEQKLAYYMSNGYLEKTAAYAKPIQATAASLILGGFQAMNIAEAISFNSTVNMAQLKIVNEYLAAKYGLDLTNGTSRSNIFNNKDFANDVIGIGKDNNMTSSATVEHNHSTGGGLELMADGFAAAGDYVFAGHNGVPPALVAGSLSTKWFVTTSGTPATVDLVFDFVKLGITPPTSTDFWDLRYSANLEGDWTSLGIAPTLSNGQLKFRVPNVQTGYYSLDFTSGADNLFAPGSVNVYPSPAADYLKVSLAGSQNGKVSFRILDYTGREVYSETTEKSGSFLVHEFNTSHYRNGMYILEIRQGNSVINKKFIRQ